MRMRLRQIVMVAEDLAAAEEMIERELGLEVGFRDPGVAEFGLRNALYPIGDKLLEVVSPTQPGTAAGRHLERRGGDSGYMVMLEVDDLDYLRRRLAVYNARIAFEAVTDGVTGLHVHPGDIGGAILSVDQADTWGEWPWAGPEWRDHVRTDTVTDAVAVVIDADQPEVMAARWGVVLGRDVRGATIELDEGEIRFVKAGERGEGVSGFVLRAASAVAAGETTICNCRFHLLP